MLKGEKLIGQSKRTAPPPFFLKNSLSSKLKPLHLQKPSWQPRGELFQGTFYLAKGKAFEKGGEFFKLENAFRNQSYTISK
jgi:hypothetical protein